MSAPVPALEHWDLLKVVLENLAMTSTKTTKLPGDCLATTGSKLLLVYTESIATWN